MKIFKLLAMVGICGIFLAACGEEDTSSEMSARTEESTEVKSSVTKEKKEDINVENSSAENNEQISSGGRATSLPNTVDDNTYKLNDTVHIKDEEGNIAYEITFTEVKDVTEEEIENYGGYENTWIDTYSNGIGKQAVRVTWIIKNVSDDVPLLSFPIGLKIIDEMGETSPGGWINKDSSIYGIDGEGFLEEDQDVFLGDTKSGAGYYILTNPSSVIKVQFSSERYNTINNFEFPVQ